MTSRSEGDDQDDYDDDDDDGDDDDIEYSDGEDYATIIRMTTTMMVSWVSGGMLTY